jgi:pSer/pThr/pTyr-binding forkhead associated (FHA) protein
MKHAATSLVIAIIAVLGIAPGASALDTQTIRKGVVRIICVGEDEADSGTGFVINSSGDIVTNYHVIRPVASGGGIIKVITDDLAEQLKPTVEARFGDRLTRSHGLVDDTLQAEIIKFLLDKLPDAKIRWTDEARDMAVLDCSASGTVPLDLTAAENVKEGEPVYALGYPGKGDKVGVTAFLTLKVYNGIVASKEFNSGSGVKVYQTTTPFSEGNSGGPLITECGSVIGINSFKVGTMVGGVDVGESVRYAIQIDELTANLKKNGIPYTPGSGCAPGGAPVAREAPAAPAVAATSSSPIMAFGVILAVLLGLAALVTAATKRGRTVVKGAVGNTVHMFRAPQPGRPATAGGPIAPGTPILRATQGEYAGRNVPLGDAPMVMGRDPQSCQLVFSLAAKDISKRHCGLRLDPGSGRILLEDLGSTNGTYVLSDGRMERIYPGRPRVLGPGERFCVGGLDNTFELQFSGAPQAQQAAPSPVLGGPPQQPQQQYGGVPGRAPVIKGINGEYAGRAIPAGPDKIVFGRDPNACQVLFPDQVTIVSKRHCSLAYDGATAAFWIEDLGSVNGTFVISARGNYRVQPGQPQRLSAGDRFFLGDQGALFEVGLG